MSSTELMNEFIKINEFSQYDTNILKNILSNFTNCSVLVT